MKQRLLTFICCALIFSSCSKENTANSSSADTHEQIRKLSESLTAAETSDDLEGLLSHYDENAISMPEYQPALNGINDIKSYYREILQRQNIKMLQRHADEIIDLGKTRIEIGTFKKEYSVSGSDTLHIQNGKYWNIWEANADGSLKLKGEAVGFFHNIPDPPSLVVNMPANTTEQPARTTRKGAAIPFELKAYSALMEKGVQARDGILRSEFFTDDARIFPFADSIRSGINKIKPYMIEYTTRGQITIDSIKVYTYDYEVLDDHVLEYTMFRVKWTVPGFSGRTEGNGIRIWKRMEDNSLKIFREIGLHYHIEQ